MGRASTVTLRKEPIILSESLFKILLLAPPGAGRNTPTPIYETRLISCAVRDGDCPRCLILSVRADSCARMVWRHFGRSILSIPFCKLIDRGEGAHNLWAGSSTLMPLSFLVVRLRISAAASLYRRRRRRPCPLHIRSPPVFHPIHPLAEAGSHDLFEVVIKYPPGRVVPPFAGC